MSVRISGGSHRGRLIRTDRERGLRPTSERVRGALFSILGRSAIEGMRVLDLYAGTGALGIEALSRGAAWADFVESEVRRCRQLTRNLGDLDLDKRSRVLCGRVERMLGGMSGEYGLVMADPPYQAAPWQTVLSRLSERGLVADGGVVVAEHRSGQPLEAGYGNLRRVDSRRYGDTSITFYKVGETGG